MKSNLDQAMVALNEQIEYLLMARARDGQGCFHTSKCLLSLFNTTHGPSSGCR